MNAVTRAWGAIKAAATTFVMRWSGLGGGGYGMWGSGTTAWGGSTAVWGTWPAGSTTRDWARDVGDGLTNAAIFACIRWAQRAAPEAPIMVMERNAADELKPLPTHPLQMLLERPNAYYSGMHLLGAVIADLMLNGNAYLLLVRSAASRVVELWWVPSASIAPRWPVDGSVFISHYDYMVNGQMVQVDPADVVHFRDGFDSRNVRLGLSPLHAMVREIATDNEAANWSASMLRNGAVPGVVIAPDGDVAPSDADLEDVKVKFQQRFGGDNRGVPLVMKGPTKVSVLSFSPEQMNLRSLRQIPEERITAVLGIPAAVVGLGAGLDTTKVGATMREMREQAFESCIVPLQRLIAAELQNQLVPAFGDPAKLRVQFDLSQVRVLQDDQNALHARAREDWLAGLVTLNQALETIGEDVLTGPEGDARLVPNTHTTVRIADLVTNPVALPSGVPPGETTGGTSVAAGAPETPALPPPAKRLRAVGAAKGDSHERDSQAALLARYEAGLATLTADLTDELLGAFEAMVDTVAGRAMAHLTAGDSAKGDSRGHGGGTGKADGIAGIVVLSDHADVRRLLRSYILKGMRQAAEDLAPLTGGTAVRMTRASQAYKAAVAAMESRLPGIVATTDADFSRLVARLERRPGSVQLSEVQAALRAYVAESYPSRAEIISRSEMTFGHGAGVLHVVQRAGLGDHVRVADGDQDAPCAAANGQTWTLEEAASRLSSHPNCTRRFTPVLAQEAA